MQKNHLFLLLTLATTIWFLPSTIAAQSPDNAAFKFKEKIDALVKPYIENEKVSAVSVAAVVDGQVWFGNYGQLSNADSSKPTANTVYEIGSVSKVFTSLLLADAVESGELKLTTPVGEVMTELKDTEFGKQVQLLHLSTHTAGLPKMPSNWSPKNIQAPYIDYDRKLLNQYIASVKTSDSLGEKYQYSNVGAGLLGDSLSAKHGKSYEAIVTSKIFKPLNMTDSSLQLSKDQQTRFAPPHNSTMMADHPWEFDSLAGAGGIRSTTTDMAKFIQANLKPPESAISKALELAWKIHLEKKTGRPALGLGWHLAGNGTTRWHNGQTGGYNSMLRIDREHGTGAIVLCNTAGGHMDELGIAVLDLLMGKNPKPKTFEESKLDAELVKRLEGKYQLSPQMILEVRGNKNGLAVKLTGQSFLQLERETDSRWRVIDVDAKLKFKLPRKGPASSATLLQNGNAQKANRIQE